MGGILCGQVNHRHRHSGIEFMTPAVVYEQARQRNLPRWSQLTRCWRQPEVA